ncbi:MAG: sulfite exporter TauE/SafE family protein [Pirellulales bacterium]
MAAIALILGIFAAALLYSSVGHGGGSGYIAMMALFNVAPESIRPAALSLNILVASIGTLRFYRAGSFSWSLFWPFALASVPCAFLGGTITLPSTLYRQVLGVVLLLAAYRLFTKPVSDTSRGVPIPLALLCGAAIGLLSGLTGVGGGIFLSPLLVLTGWANTKQSCGVSAAFILVNSIAGILGLMTKGATLPAELPYWTIAAIAGGLIGSELGAKRLASPTLRRLLAVVLVIAALKLILI